MKRYLLVFVVMGCMSRSVFDARFRESALLAAPTVSVTLPNPDAFSFAVVGDTHVGGQDTARLRRILTAAAAEGDAFVVFLGDIVDTGEREDIVAVQTAVSDLGFTNKVIPVIGNHDVFEMGWEPYKELWGASHFAVTVGNSKFIVLDTADGTLGLEHKEWLENELRQGGATNTFLLSHYLPFIPGQRTYLRLSNEVEAMKLMKMASRFQVRAWLGAHYHSYATENVENVM